MSRKVPDWIKGYMEYVENSEPALLFHEWSAIFTIAAALRRKCFFDWGHVKLYPNLYVILVAPPGARKGTAMGFAEGFLEELGIALASNTGSREGLIRQLNETEDMDLDPNTGDMKTHCSLTVFSKELTVFLGYDNKQLIMDLTDWYDSPNIWDYNTKNKELRDKINGVWVNLMGATTPDQVRSALTQQSVGGGLVSRMIFIFEERVRKGVAFPFFSTEQLNLRDLLREDLEKIAAMRGKFMVTEDFFPAWEAWYVNQLLNPPQNTERILGYNSRRQNHVLKLCMCISAATRDDLGISAEILHRAVDLLERTERKMARTFEGYGRGKSAEVATQIMQYLIAQGSAEEAELLGTFKDDLDDEAHLTKIMGVLTRIGFCSSKIDGRGRTFYTFNPGFKGGAYSQKKDE